MCPDCGSGLVFGEQVLPEEQLEHSGWDAGVDLCYRHSGFSPLQFWYQDPGHAQSAAAAEDPEASTVSSIQGLLRVLVKVHCTLW